MVRQFLGWPLFTGYDYVFSVGEPNIYIARPGLYARSLSSLSKQKPTVLQLS